ncbi:MAG: hypothetical protein AAGJ08_09250 [Cyanobacteria bacterium P01_H01_bin.35]
MERKIMLVRAIASTILLYLWGGKNSFKGDDGHREKIQASLDKLNEVS